MKRKITALFLSVLMLFPALAGCVLADETPARSGGPGGQGGQGGMMQVNDADVQAVLDENADKFQQFSFADPDTGITLEYSLFIPETYYGSEAFPLLMFIPDSTGAGKSAKELVQQYYGADIWVTAEEQAKHPCFVLVPAFSETVVQDDWSTSEQIEAAVNLIRALQEEYSIDPYRIYTTGQSMGCMTSLYLNSKYPELFAASMFVSGQWDISVLKPLENAKFFYITAGGDTKASGGQDEVRAMFDADGVACSYGTWSAQDAAETQDAAVAALLAEGADANMIRFETGTVFKDGQSGSEHMASFNYGYRLTAVRDWLFTNTRRYTEGSGETAAAHWYDAAVAYVTEHGMMQGTGNGFEPENATDRASVFQTLYNLEGKPMVVQMLSFLDTDGKWYASVATWAKGCGLAEGDENGNFSGDRAITRAELVTVLYRYAQYKGIDVSVGEDTNILSYDDAFGLPSWCVSAFQWACGAGIINGKGNLLAPNDGATRAELAAILTRFAPLADGQTPAAGIDKLDMTKWQYNADDDVYYQLGIPYCASPADSGYETMGFFVPGAYFTAADNGDGTYTCAVNPTGEVKGYTAATAPFVIPINTPGYAAMSAPTDYSSSCGYGSAADFTGAGFILTFAGARGRDAGAPGGVTDFKAAIRYTRYNADRLPGDPERYFSLGMSGGGAQSALLGTTGDSALYTPYLKAIGAVTEEGVSDALYGSMCWCPITNLDVADAAYEWNLGMARSGLDEETKALSDGLARAFAEYINALKLADGSGTSLTLAESETGIWQSGSYYDYIKGVIETSLEHFLADTAFPYDASASSSGGRGMGGFGGAGRPNFGGDGELPAGGPEGTADYTAIDDIHRNQAGGGLSLSGTYDTIQDYIDALNAEGEWVSYDAASGKVTITGVADFVAALKNPSKDVGAFDALDRSQGENTLFGYGDGAGAHFDAIEAGLLAGTEYESAYAEDLAKQDALGNTVDYRVNMYNPMYFLCSYYPGAGSAKIAPCFRIRTGINQGDTALCTEVDLALALAAYGSTVDFETVWGQGHTQAERTGSSTENFISWVNACVIE